MSSSPPTASSAEASASINLKEAELYDRQIRLWGVRAQNQLKQSRTLCVGLNALGAELVKNIVLAGLNVTVADPNPVNQRDLGAQFFLRDEDVGKPRALASLQRIQELNPFAKVEALQHPLESQGAEFYASFDVVVLVNQPFAVEMRVNKCCRGNGRTKFITAHSYGMQAIAFCDFQEHTYAKVGSGGAILSETPETVSYLSLGQTHQFSWGALNAQFRRGLEPLYFCHTAIQNGLGGMDCKAAEARFGALCVQNGLSAEQVPTALFRQVHSTQGAHIAPVCAIMGGLLGQEVIKVISEQNRPCDNWLFFNGVACTAVVQRLSVEKKAAVVVPQDEVMDLLTDSDSDDALQPE